MINILEVRKEVNEVYHIDITTKSNTELYTTARYNFRAICLDLGFSVCDIADALKIARMSIYNKGFVNYEAKGLHKVIKGRVVNKFINSDYFTILDGHKIKGKPLNSLMFELSTWSEEDLIEFMETSVKNFKRKNFI